MGRETRVNTTDLRDLADTLRDVAAHINTADHMTNGVAKNVAFSHGVACLQSIGALSAANYSRGAAAQALQAVSNSLASKLDAAAGQYDSTDQQQAGGLDGQMHPR
ncbi:ESX-1 secretion-associated protein [Mycobacterium sp. M1]|uniref:ESX-1 secretion-associated protein n=1 Tax=Mycolicibacter acidiphilus TaxID=2835306 RepID=A0ABS5RGL8_9MYCO|nr:type VII secretion target [Mycolicibacter acidiphilus]MBS9532779.1 ESX-1 secretion-associated protein [Mycolicibacter acidiphilus]